MPHPIDDKGAAGTTATVVGIPTDSTTVATLPGQGAVSWEHAHDSKALYLPMMRGKLSRGYLVQDKHDPAVKQNKHGRPLGLRFLYNPTTVQVSYQLATDIYPSDPSGGAAPGGGVALVGVPGSASLSFDLNLDRTYDVWKNRRSRGVRYDVEQFQSMLAYSDDTPFIQPVSVWVVFGNPMLKYYGFIQSFSVLYTNWTQAMVPYRGAISGITMQVLPSGKKQTVKTVTSASNYTAAGAGAATTDSTSTSNGTGRG